MLSDPVRAAIEFFLYDSVKILFLLFLFVFLIGVLRTFLPLRKAVKVITSLPLILAHLFASLLGAITPFCSCSSIPVFWSLLRAGAPLGPSLSFLITSPLVNEQLVVLLIAAFGLKVAVVYAIAGIVLGTLAGMVLGAKRFKLTRFIEKDVRGRMKEERIEGWRKRLLVGWKEAWGVVRRVWLWVLAGVALGAIIHNWVPQEAIERVIAWAGWWGVPLVVLIGVPLYGGAAALVPIAAALFAKGVPLGTAVAFLMAVAGLSFPEAVILRKAMRLELILLFFGVVALGIILIGYGLNILF